MSSITEPASTTAPQPVRTSSLLYIVSAVLGLIGFVITLVLLPAATSAVEQQLQGQSSSSGVDVHAIAVGSAIGAAVVGGLIAIAFAVLTIVFARKMRNGRNWARIVLLVFAALHVLGLLGLIAGTTPILSALLSVLVAVAAAVAAVLSFLPESSAWFRSVKAAQPVA
jgi:hypothetical protein